MTRYRRSRQGRESWLYSRARVMASSQQLSRSQRRSTDVCGSESNERSVEMTATEEPSSRSDRAEEQTSQRVSPVAHRRPNESPFSGREPRGDRTPPNPCAPERESDDCDCPKPPGARDTPKRPKRPKPRRDDCCEQLIEILRSVPGLEIPKP